MGAQNEQVTKKSESDYTVMKQRLKLYIQAVIFLRCMFSGNTIIAFAIGMIVSALFPYTFAVMIIAAVLILAGLSLCRY